MNVEGRESDDVRLWRRHDLTSVVSTGASEAQEDVYPSIGLIIDGDTQVGIPGARLQLVGAGGAVAMAWTGIIDRKHPVVVVDRCRVRGMVDTLQPSACIKALASLG